MYVSPASHVRSFRGSSARIAVMLLASTNMSTTFVLQARLEIYRQWPCMEQESLTTAVGKACHQIPRRFWCVVLGVGGVHISG